MSLCLSADAARFAETAPAATGLSARLRRFLLSFDPADEAGDMLPAPIVKKPRKTRHADPSADEVNALLL